MILLLCLPTARAYQPPNSTLSASIGYPALLSGRGEAWLADELSVEIGAGALGEVDPFGFDTSIRWRPDLLCFACGQRALVTLGFGAGGVINPPVGFDGPWAFAAGPDVAVTAIYWFSPVVGLSLSAHGGVGPGFVGDDFGDVSVEPWGFGGLGLAF